MEHIMENKQWKGVYYSEFIASWNTATLEGITPLFKDWLAQIEKDGERMPPEVVNEIVNFAISGRLSLEQMAASFIRKVYTLEVITAEGGESK